MRSVNYVQRVSLDFTGTLFPHAICLGDADNDSVNDAIVFWSWYRTVVHLSFKYYDVTVLGSGAFQSVAAVLRHSIIYDVFSVLQLNELVVGDTSGKLLVYKNDDTKPWITRSCVGMVSEMKSDALILKYVHSFESCVCASS